MTISSRAPLASLLLAAAGTVAAATPVPRPDPNFYCGDDRSCGDQGYSFLAVDRGGSNADQFAEVFVLPDGKTLTVGAARSAIDNVVAIGRLTADGTRDATYGNNGVRLGNVGVDVVYDAELDATGRLWVLYEVANTTTFGLARFTPAGLPDVTFAGDGAMLVDPTAFDETDGKLTLAPDGKAFVAGSVRATTDAWRLAIVRIAGDGSFDATFDGDGIETVDPATNGSPAARWRPGVLVAGGYGNVATIVADLNGVPAGRFPAFIAGVQDVGGGNIDFRINDFDAATNGTCADSPTVVGATLIRDGVPLGDGSFVAAGTFRRSSDGVSQALFARFRANGTINAECFVIGESVGTPIGIRTPGSNLFVVHAFIDFTARRLELIQLDNGTNFTPVVIPTSRVARTWPTATGVPANLSGDGLAVGYGRVVLGGTRTWTSGSAGTDTDFALAGYRYDDVLFGNSFE